MPKISRGSIIASVQMQRLDEARAAGLRRGSSRYFCCDAMYASGPSSTAFGSIHTTSQ